MKTFSFGWSEQLGEAIARAAPRRGYPMSLVGEELQAAIDAVNQGIDSRLEACFVPARGDCFKPGERSFIATHNTPFWKKGNRVVHTRTLECTVSPESLPVLLRRLMESGDEAAESLASGICETLDIELI
jgi:hypothetical protein